MAFKQDLIAIGRFNRPGTKIKPTSITVHNTGNGSWGADAKMHAKYIKSTDKKVSWHYTVDDKYIIQHIPWNEIAWHSGCSDGNSTSIGIEICMNSDCDIQKAEENAQLLIADLMKETGIKVIKKHQDWTGKYCPQVLLRENRWAAFVKGCLDKYNEKYIKQIKKVKEIKEHWAEKYYQSLLKKGIEIDDKRFDDVITRGEVFALLDRLINR